MYNISVENPTGRYGEAVSTPIEGNPRKHATILVYSCPKPNETIEPICQTCYDMCNAISDPPEGIILDHKGKDRRHELTGYFVDARTTEWQSREKK